jgi:hypothetical protein
METFLDTEHLLCLLPKMLNAWHKRLITRHHYWESTVETKQPLPLTPALPLLGTSAVVKLKA